MRDPPLDAGIDHGRLSNDHVQGTATTEGRIAPQETLDPAPDLVDCLSERRAISSSLLHRSVDRCGGAPHLGFGLRVDEEQAIFAGLESPQSSPRSRRLLPRASPPALAQAKLRWIRDGRKPIIHLLHPAIPPIVRTASTSLWATSVNRLKSLNESARLDCACRGQNSNHPCDLRLRLIWAPVRSARIAFLEARVRTPPPTELGRALDRPRSVVRRSGAPVEHARVVQSDQWLFGAVGAMTCRSGT